MSKTGDRPKPVLDPLLDLEALVRAVAFRLLITSREPIAIDTLAASSVLAVDRLEALVEQLDEAGRIRRDSQGRVIGSAGLSVVPDRHRIELEGKQFWTWCAYDIFGIFGALRADGQADSPSPANGSVIHLSFVQGRPQRSRAVLFRPDAALMACCENVYRDWCPNSNLFANRGLADAWALAHSRAGRVLRLDEAADLATDEWQPLTTGLTLAKE